MERRGWKIYKRKQVAQWANAGNFVYRALSRFPERWRQDGNCFAGWDPYELLARLRPQLHKKPRSDPRGCKSPEGNIYPSRRRRESVSFVFAKIVEKRIGSAKEKRLPYLFWYRRKDRVRR